MRELAIAQGFVLIGIPFPEAIAASLLYGVIPVLVALPGVGVLFLSGKMMDA
ncbi:MAG: hypothetical protein JKY00_14795 [Roseicyclus sp.]|nr:hypothetical protein [Roseicyclus sp.]